MASELTMYPPPPPPPAKRLPPPLPPNYRPLPFGMPKVDVSAVKLPAVHSQDTLEKAAATIQRKYRAVRACRVFKQFRTLLNQFKMKNTDPKQLQKSAKLKVVTFNSPAQKQRILNDLKEWNEAAKGESDPELFNAISLAAQISYAIKNDLAGQIIAVYDENGRLQGVGQLNVKKGFFEIGELVTAPWNLDIEGYKDDPRRVRGAGTALIEEAIVNSMKAGYLGEVHLDAVSSAFSFYYTKMGLGIAERVPANSELIPMKLTTIADFFRKNGGRALPA